MNSKVSFRGCHLRQSPYFTALPHQQRLVFKIVCCEKSAGSSNSSSSPPSPTDDKFGFRQARQYWEEKRPKLNGIDVTDLVQESVNHWLTKTQRFLNGVASPLVKNVHERSPDIQNDDQNMVEFLFTEQTIDSRTPGGELSEAAIVSIEQFSRKMAGSNDRSKEAVGMVALHEALRSVCLNSEWTYSVFWTIRPRPRLRGGGGCRVGDDNGSLMLMWEDGFCRGRVAECLDEVDGEDPVRKTFSKMSIQLYNYGEGWVLG